MLNSQYRLVRTQLIILTAKKKKKNAGDVYKQNRVETKLARIHLLHNITMRGHGREN